MVRSNADIELSIRRTLAELSRHIEVRRAFLFGSYAQGTADEDSDIDLAVFTPSVDHMTIEAKVGLIARVGMAVREPVELHLFSDRLLSRATTAEFAGFIRQSGREIPVS